MNEKNQFSQILGKESLENFFKGSLALIGSDLPHTTKVLALLVSNEINKANNILLKHNDDSSEYVEHFRTGNHTCVTLTESFLCAALGGLSHKQVKRIVLSLEKIGFTFSFYYSKKNHDGFYTFEGSLLPVFNDTKIYIPKFIFDQGFSSSVILTYIVMLNNLFYNHKDYSAVNYEYIKTILNLSSSSIRKSLTILSSTGFIKVKSKVKYKGSMYFYNIFSSNTCHVLSNLLTPFKILDSLKLEKLNINGEKDGLMVQLKKLVEIKDKKTDKNGFTDEKNGITGDIFCDNNLTYLKSFNSYELSQLACCEEERIYISRVLAAKKFHLFKRMQILKAQDVGLPEDVVDARISCFIQMYLKSALINFRRMLRNDSRANRELYLETLESGPFSNRKVFILANLFFSKNLELCSLSKIKDMIKYSFTSFFNLFSNTLNWDLAHFEVKASVFC